MMRLYFELVEHLGYVALKNDLLLLKSQKNAQERVNQVGAGKKRIIQRFSVVFGRAIEYHTYLLLTR